MPARLLLIEDDVSIARFVALALEELAVEQPAAPAVELTVVRHLAAARDALAAAGWQLVISDLMLPDGSAETLLHEGLARAVGAPPWVVFSAGLRDDQRDALAALGVARTLRKPVSLAELLATVAALLGHAAAPSAEPAELAELAVVDPVAQHFGGDPQLFERFRAGCMERFGDDLLLADAACTAGDLPTLHRVVHSLKSVLTLIGQPRLAAQAQALERATAATAPGQPCPPGWPALADGLVALGARRP